MYLVFFLGACSTPTAQPFYEGLRSLEKAKGTQGSANPNAMPNFQQYQQDRENLKGGS